MICHSQIATDRPLIQQLAAMQEKGIDLAWQRVYDYTREAHVRFDHAPHIRSQASSARPATATGAADRRRARRRRWTWRFCVNCHKSKQASNDCLTCHY